MRVVPAGLPGLFVIEPTVFTDERGSFAEIWRIDQYANAGLKASFVQDNQSVTVKGALRGLHFQHPNGQLKLCRVVKGEVFDAVVDVRRGSPTFGKYYATILSAENRRQLWVPEGFAHGFVALSEEAVFLYKVTGYWSPPDERGIAWNDPALGIDWPVANPSVSPKDAAFAPLAKLPPEHLPAFSE